MTSGKLDFRAAGARVVSFEMWRGIDAFVARFGILFILALAAVYYGQYYRSGLNLGGEGGTAAVVAMRLMEGQRPIVDTFLGYNVMWFYPVVWLFDVTGPNYIALRFYFFTICVIGAILGFLILRRFTGSGLFSLLFASLLVLMPGMLFRNYMPFLGLLNMYLLLQAYVFPRESERERWIWLVLAGLGLALTFLIRVDLGIFFSAICVGLTVISVFQLAGSLGRRVALAAGGLVLVVAVILLAHWPVYVDAKKRGFSDAFVCQYSIWLTMMGNELSKGTRAQPGAVPTTPATTVGAGGTPAITVKPLIDKDVLKRQPLANAFKGSDFSDRVFVIITYLPIVVAGVLVLVFSFICLQGLIRRDAVSSTAALAVLTATGCSLTLFPQFFFFRPDTPHLSEFMAPFLVAMGCASWQAVLWLRTNICPARLAVAGVVLLLCVANASLYTIQSLPKESCGSIAATKKRTVRFQAGNGVDVLVKKDEAKSLEGLYQVLMAHTGPDDYVVCYPYAPTINFMTNRRSFEHNLYVDNNTAPAKFHDQTVAKMAEFRPAAIVIDNRRINRSDSSQFANWASATYEYIRSTYKHAGTFGRQEVYLRPDKFNP